MDWSKDPQSKVEAIKSKLNRVIPGLYSILEVLCRQLYGKSFGDVVLSGREKALEVLKEFYGDVVPAEVIVDLIFDSNC